MTRALPRTNFNSSKLTRFLADLSVEDAAESSQAFAERLGEWLDFSDAITLSTLLGTSATSPSKARSGAPSVERLAVVDEFTRVRTALMASIAKSCSPTAGEIPIKWPAANSGEIEFVAVTAAYEPYRRIHFAHQREMESALRPLRARVRDALAKASPLIFLVRPER